MWGGEEGGSRGAECRTDSSSEAVVHLPLPEAQPWPWLCTRTAAPLLPLAQACAVTLRGSFIAACATASRLVKQSNPFFLSLFLCLDNNQGSGALISAGYFCSNPPVIGAFSSALFPY